MSVDEFESLFFEYNRYAKQACVAGEEELKELYDLGQCDVYFEFTEERTGRSVEMLRFKFRKMP
jgi:hypothetical protein